MTRELTVSISYVIREADGIDAFDNFIDSLEKFPIPKSISLYILLKESRELFRLQIQNRLQASKIKANIVVGSDGGFDLGSHLEIASRVSSDLLVLFTSTTQPCSKNWILSLTQPFKDQQVGIVGSMFSNESLKTSYLLLIRLKLKHKLSQKLNGFESDLSSYWGISKEKVSPMLLVFRLIKIPNFFFRKIEKTLLCFIAKLNPWKSVKNFPEFPNPHIRTTGMAIRRDLYVEILDKVPVSKFDAFNYESGSDSITKRAEGLGYKVGLVQKNGVFVSIQNPKARTTFRFVGGDSLISDHQSRHFHTLSKRHKLILTKITQGK